ncbi:MAG TPA: hypothetical protein VMR80_10535 [Candidatus Acidoferrum sp.]|nr:hypothetical protein [Candidatus Acidoferrum sp.]
MSYFLGGEGYFNVNAMSDLDYVNRMLDYAHGVHSLPESAASGVDQDAEYGAQWHRPSCACELYAYTHGGCPGAAAKRLPRGWKSGDDL